MKKLLLFLHALCLSLLIFAPSSGFCQAEDERATQIDTTSRFDALFDKGREFESEGKWREAITTYQIIIKLAKGESQTRAYKRVDFCTTNLFMDARYSRQGYLGFVKGLTHGGGIKFFTEVEDKIGMRYVDAVDLKKLFVHGLDFLRIALKNRVVKSRFPKLSSASKSDEFLRVIDTILAQVTKKRSLSARDGRSYLTTLSAHNRINLDVPPGIIFAECVQGMLSCLDPYSHLLTQDLVEELNILERGEVIGTGAEVVIEDHAPKVVAAPNGTPAKKAGLQPGDRILEIDGESVEWLTEWAIEKKLRGKIGGKISLLVKRDGSDKPIEVTIALAPVEIASVVGLQLLDDKKKIGYVRLDALNQKTKSDLESAISSLKAKGMAALILDLRNNGGGVLDVAVDIANMFLSDGVIVSIKGRWAPANKEWSATAANTNDKLPIAVLINKNSASGAEIIASALRDHKRATLVGTTTKGKGSAQTTIQLDTCPAALNLTVARYYPPSGKSFDGIGVAPDIMVNQVPPPNGQTTATDPQLAAAIEFLVDSLRR